MTEITQADRDAAAEAFFCKPLLNEKHNDDHRVRAFARHRQYGYDQGYYDGRQADGAEERANGRIEALQADNAKLRDALRVYAGPMEWTQEGGWGMFPVWADGYPGGVYLDDNTLDFGEAARAALQETDETFTRSSDT